MLLESKVLAWSNFPHKTLHSFLKIQTVIKSCSLMTRALGHFDIFNMLFPFLAFLKLQLGSWILNVCTQEQNL